MGGIEHLSPEEQQKIDETARIPQHVCCYDPYWRYRLFQDTIVKVDEIDDLIDDAMAELSEDRSSNTPSLSGKPN